VYLMILPNAPLCYSTSAPRREPLSLSLYRFVRTSTAASSSTATASTRMRNRPWPTSTYSFFFQAEDGIRDSSVTGVQTCALPICRSCAAQLASRPAADRTRGGIQPRGRRRHGRDHARLGQTLPPGVSAAKRNDGGARSEERRVGKECRGRWLA